MSQFRVVIDSNIVLLTRFHFYLAKYIKFFADFNLQYSTELFFTAILLHLEAFSVVLLQVCTDINAMSLSYFGSKKSCSQHSQFHLRQAW